MTTTSEKKIQKLLKLREMKAKSVKPWPEIRGLKQEPKA